MTDRVPLIPKVPGGPLRMLMIGRISQEDQDPESIDAGLLDAGDSLARIDEGPIAINSPGGRDGEIQEDRP
jgi:hypothetical protein